MLVDAIVINPQTTMIIINACYQQEDNNEKVRPMDNTWYYLIKVTSAQIEKGGQDNRWLDKEWKPKNEIIHINDLINDYWWVNKQDSEQDPPEGDNY